MRRVSKQKLLGMLGIVLVALFVFLFWGRNPFVQSQPVSLTIKKEMTGREIADLLAQKEVICNPMLFRAAAFFSGSANELQEGHYDLETNMPPAKVVAALKNGRAPSATVVIPEGFDVRHIAKRLAAAGVVEEAAFLTTARNFPLPEDMKGKQPVDFNAEGFLFPDTYQVPLNASPNDILVMMNQELQRKLTPEIRQRIAAAGWSLHDFMTLASLVEKEAKYPEDRSLIAAVFKKRLAIGIPLQSCASIQYILGEAKPVLSIADTQIPSAYNTYLNPGLPPGPIASPGSDAMRAVLEAQPTEYLYFVAASDGHHHFSRTYEEHLKNVAKLENEY